MASWVDYKEWVALKAFYRRIDEQILPSWAINILYSYMEENKYYIPTLEEFHVGFEYEYDHPKLGWDKNIVGLPAGDWDASSLYEFNDEIEEGSIRVKYLDREDIESLGFNVGIEGPHSYMSFTKDIYWLQYGSFTEDASIQLSIQNLEMKEFVFWGTIKNKSQLKVLLKQLQIL